jgi:ribonuclease Z
MQYSETDGSMRVTLLGTGGPELSPDRYGAATLIEAGGETLLFDAGRGVMQRLYECGIRINSVTKVFFTHLHSDHIDGLPNLWITPWFLLGRSEPMTFWGPKRTRSMLDGMRQFLAHDIEARAEPGSPASDLAYEAHEFEGATLVYDAGGVRVRSVPVDHKDGNPAYGFVIDYGQRRVILSGDCTYSEALATVGDADLVLHNVFAPSAELLERDSFKRDVAKKLATPEDAARVFRRNGTKLAVYTHVIPMDSSDRDIIDRTRSAGYAGRLVMGADRMQIVVGAEIVVIPPGSLERIPEVTRRGHG